MQPECSELRLDCAAHDEHEKDRIVSMALTGNVSSHSSQLSGQAMASPPLSCTYSRLFLTIVMSVQKRSVEKEWSG